MTESLKKIDSVSVHTRSSNVRSAPQSHYKMGNAIPPTELGTIPVSIINGHLNTVATEQSVSNLDQQNLFVLDSKMKKRKLIDRGIGALMWGSIIIIGLILLSLSWELIVRGTSIISPYFLSVSMNGVYGGMPAGGIYHALLGTFLITTAAAVISVPIGLAVAIYLVEYAAETRFAKFATTLVDVMTGIPSIVAGLFAAALFSMTVGPAYRAGIMGAVALSVLMIPIVIRSSVELLKLVPQDLREAAYALGIPKWRTIISVVLRTAGGGLVTANMVALARVIGETAPLLLTAGVVQSINSNLFQGRMMTLPVYIYQEYTANVSCAVGAVNCNPFINLERAWGAALVLVVSVLTLNLLARYVTRFLTVKG